MGGRNGRGWSQPSTTNDSHPRTRFFFFFFFFRTRRSFVSNPREYTRAELAVSGRARLRLPVQVPRTRVKPAVIHELVKKRSRIHNTSGSSRPWHCLLEC